MRLGARLSITSFSLRGSVASSFGSRGHGRSTKLAGERRHFITAPLRLCCSELIQIEHVVLWGCGGASSAIIGFPALTEVVAKSKAFTAIVGSRRQKRFFKRSLAAEMWRRYAAVYQNTADSWRHLSPRARRGRNRCAGSCKRSPTGGSDIRTNVPAHLYGGRLVDRGARP